MPTNFVYISRKHQKKEADGRLSEKRKERERKERNKSIPITGFKKYLVYSWQQIMA